MLGSGSTRLGHHATLVVARSWRFASADVVRVLAAPSGDDGRVAREAGVMERVVRARAQASRRRRVVPMKMGTWSSGGRSRVRSGWAPSCQATRDADFLACSARELASVRTPNPCY